MPADGLYWSPIELESDESTSRFSKTYIDPWDLENYAYIRQHLDSLELPSECSSPEAQLESSSTFSYIAVGDGGDGGKKYDPFTAGSERDGSAPNYASIDEIERVNEGIARYRRQSDVVFYRGSGKYERNDCNFDDDDPYEAETQHDSSTYVYETRPQLRKMAPTPRRQNSRTRSYSYTCGDHGHGNEHQHHRRTRHGLDETADRGVLASSPIYDDIRTNPVTPNNFGLSNYGHLKIDYSYSWNNLNKYIYN